MVYNVGEIVLVDGINKAYIEVVEVDEDTDEEDDDEIKFRIKYLVSEHIERNVCITRLKPTILAGSTRSEQSLFLPQQESPPVSYTSNDGGGDGGTSIRTLSSSLTTSSSLRATSNNNQQQQPLLLPTTNTPPATTTSVNNAITEPPITNNNPPTTSNDNDDNTSTSTSNDNNNDNTSTSSTSSSLSEIDQLKKAMKDSFDFLLPSSSKRRNCCHHPLYEFLKSKFNDTSSNTEAGWIRYMITENKYENSNNNDTQQCDILLKNHLSPTERTVLINIISFFSGFASTNGVVRGWKRYTTYAFGIKDYRSMKRIYSKWVEQGFNHRRKVRKDKDMNIFNSPKKRKHHFTALTMYKKHRYNDFRDCMGRISAAELRHDFNQLSATEKSKYEIQAQQCLLRSSFLWEELRNILLKSKGKVSYEAFANYLKNIVSANTIRSVLNSKEGFYLRHDKILPHLDKSHKEKRDKWSKRFVLFWDAVKKYQQKNVYTSLSIWTKSGFMLVKIIQIVKY